MILPYFLSTYWFSYILSPFIFVIPKRDTLYHYITKILMTLITLTTLIQDLLDFTSPIEAAKSLENCNSLDRFEIRNVRNVPKLDKIRLTLCIYW